MYRFGNPSALQLLWLIPFLLFLSWLLVHLQTRQLVQNMGEKLSQFLASSLSTRKRKLKIVLEVGAILLFIFSLARPQSGESRQQVKSEGVEILLLVDVSESMLTEDVKPSRLELAKKEITRLLDQSVGDRIGLVAFAGSAVLLSPVTTDKAALKMFVESLSPNTVSTQGTEFRKALEEARSAFARGGLDTGEEGVVTRVILIASDGEDNEPGAMEAAEELVKAGIRIFTLGFGTEKGGPIPQRDERGQLRGYKKDSEGKVVLSTTKGTVLKSLAEKGKGAFHHLTFGSNVMKQIHDEIRRLEQTTFDSAEVVNYDENYQSFLLLGLFLAFIELLLGERRRIGRLWKGRFEVRES